MYEELIKRLKDYSTARKGEIAELTEKAADAIEKLSEILDDTKHNYDLALEDLEREWIPVTERLPDGDSPYIAYLKAPDDWEFHDELSYVTMLEFDKRQMLWWQSENSCFNADINIVSNDCKVTHWMPLPEPPKEEQT